MIDMEKRKMTARELFLKGRYIHQELLQLQIAKRKAMDMACSVSISNSEKVQESQRNNQENKMVNYTDYSQMLDEKISELERYRKVLFQVINEIDNPVHRTLLTARYVNCLTWEQISEYTGYSEKWIRKKLFPEALNEAEKKIGEVIPRLSML